MAEVGKPQRLPGWLRWLPAYGGLIGAACAIFFNFVKQEPVRQALIDTAIPMIPAAMLGGLYLLIDSKLRGRARLWTRIGWVSFLLALIVIAASLGNGGLNIVLITGAIWLVATGGLVTLALRQPEVAT